MVLPLVDQMVVLMAAMMVHSMAGQKAENWVVTSVEPMVALKADSMAVQKVVMMD